MPPPIAHGVPVAEPPPVAELLDHINVILEAHGYRIRFYLFNGGLQIQFNPN